MSSKQPTTHAAHTKGGMAGHVTRRMVHIGMAILPILYYFFGEHIAAWFSTTPNVIVIILVTIVLVLEIIRFFTRWTAFGQREHEARHISSFAWAALSIGIVLMLMPKQYGIPIVWCCAFVDPLIGELRRANWSAAVVALIGVIGVIIIWLIATVWLGAVWWLALLMGPIIVAAEWPILSWIDDNALMQFVPLIVIFLLQALGWL